MTTLVAVRKDDHIAIAADSLTTFGDTRLAADHDRTYRQDRALPRHTTSACAARPRTSSCSRACSPSSERLDFCSRLAIFETLRKLHPILKEQHFLNPKEEEDDPYESTQITALIANAHGIFGVYSMREVFEYTQFWAAGSGKRVRAGRDVRAVSAAQDAPRPSRRPASRPARCSTRTRRCR